MSEHPTPEQLTELHNAVWAEITGNANSTDDDKIDFEQAKRFEKLFCEKVGFPEGYDEAEFEKYWNEHNQGGYYTKGWARADMLKQAAQDQ